MNIGLIAHDAKKKLMQNFCIAYRGILCKNELLSLIHILSSDSNQLTKSGYITPVVDFKHLQEVLVITKLKETGESDFENENNKTQTDSDSSEAETASTEE